MSSRQRPMIDAWNDLRRASGEVQVAALAALGLVLAPLAPWIDEGTQFSGPGYALGIDLNTGELTFLIGVTAILVTVRLVRRVSIQGAAALSGLGLLAGALVVDKAIQLHEQAPFSVAWGMYVGGGAALLLLACGLILMGGEQNSASPPD